jgi:hypothetical protein
VAQIKVLFRDLKMTDLADLAAKASQFQSASEVGDYVEEYLCATPAYYRQRPTRGGVKGRV